MEAVILSLLLWINQNTHFDYDIHNGIPSLVATDQIELAALIIDDDATLMKVKNTATFKSYIDQLEAVYNHDSQTIHISSKIDLQSAYAHSVIVHELVHFIQYQEKINETVECLSALERDAYDIQAMYMDQHHIPKNFDKLTVALRSMCMDYTE